MYRRTQKMSDIRQRGVSTSSEIIIHMVLKHKAEGLKQNSGGIGPLESRSTNIASDYHSAIDTSMNCTFTARLSVIL